MRASSPLHHPNPLLARFCWTRRLYYPPIALVQPSVTLSQDADNPLIINTVDGVRNRVAVRLGDRIYKWFAATPDRTLPFFAFEPKAFRGICYRRSYLFGCECYDSGILSRASVFTTRHNGALLHNAVYGTLSCRPATQEDPKPRLDRDRVLIARDASEHFDTYMLGR